MDALERIIGKLEAHHEHSERRFNSLESKVDGLQQFKWRVAGGAAALALVISCLVELIHMKG
jgi:hypothetical protein